MGSYRVACPQLKRVYVPSYALSLSLSLFLSLSLPRDFVRGVVYVRPSTNICDSRMFVIHIHEQLSVRETCSELNQVLVDFEYFVMSSVQPTQ